ncbi:sodium/potassium-transporting ATPase subunit gamma isoform X3 [Callithrix jacchus]
MTTLNDCPETQESGEKREACLETGDGGLATEGISCDSAEASRSGRCLSLPPSLPASPRALGLEEKRRAQLDASFSLAWNHQTKEVYWVCVEKEAGDVGRQPPGGHGPILLRQKIPLQGQQEAQANH